MGSDEMVARGAYGGQPAVVKLFGPDSEALVTYANELQMYSATTAAQGRDLPDFLGAGYLGWGVYFIAIKYVDGTPLSEMPSLSADVRSAAVAALERLQQTIPGFIHGDIRLHNILLSSDTAARCVFVDLGRSRLGGSAAEMRQEIKQLRRLLGQ